MEIKQIQGFVSDLRSEKTASLERNDPEDVILDLDWHIKRYEIHGLKLDDEYFGLEREGFNRIEHINT